MGRRPGEAPGRCLRVRCPVGASAGQGRCRGAAIKGRPRGPSVVNAMRRAEMRRHHFGVPTKVALRGRRVCGGKPAGGAAAVAPSERTLGRERMPEKGACESTGACCPAATSRSEDVRIYRETVGVVLKSAIESPSDAAVVSLPLPRGLILACRGVGCVLARESHRFHSTSLATLPPR